MKSKMSERGDGWKSINEGWYLPPYFIYFEI